MSITDLCASDSKYNSKTELGIKRNKGLIASPGKGDCNRLRPSETAGPPRGRGLVRGWEGREIQDLAGFYRNCVCVPASLVVFGLVCGS